MWLAWLLALACGAAAAGVSVTAPLCTPGSLTDICPMSDSSVIGVGQGLLSASGSNGRYWLTTNSACELVVQSVNWDTMALTTVDSLGAGPAPAAGTTWASPYFGLTSSGQLILWCQDGTIGGTWPQHTGSGTYYLVMQSDRGVNTYDISVTPPSLFLTFNSQTGNVHPASVGTCTPCPSGFQSHDIYTMCKPCDPGSYSTGGQPYCTSCPTGLYQPTAGAAACSQACTNGGVGATYTGTGATTATCTFTCNLGYYVAGGSCNPCSSNAAPGYYSTTPGITAQTQCQACPAGKFAPVQTGVSACTDCPAQTYSTTPVGQCTPCRTTSGCTAGCYVAACTATADTQCVACGGNTVAQCATGNSCNAGYQAAVCAGTETTDPGCTACPDGKFSSGGGACSTCPAGWFLQSTTSVGCTQCASAFLPA